ncbi:hypothetical protein MTR67_031043 [Solanum verrucosum]|uniref:Uncharacterized protein n=1 Tax=Solanum verrucosum TaxID=315347 RepID=A0AAF0U1Q9_SOLVR|nr:hypothetical protein MTR67_031043 [Solanum verrucosum]
MVADALSRLSMSNVAQVEDEWFGIIFSCDYEAKQDLDPILVELKKSVSTKAIEALSQGRDGVLHYQG